MAPKILRQIYSWTMACSHTLAKHMPLDMLLRTCGYGPLIFAYHTVSDTPLPHISNIYRQKNIREFEADLDYFLSELTPVTLQDLRDYILNGKKLHPRSFFLAFDDGLQECASIIAPLLKRKGIPAAFFINSGFIGNTGLFFRFKTSILLHRFKTSGVSDSESDKIRGLVEAERMPWNGGFPETLLSLRYRHNDLLDRISYILGVDFADYLKTQKPYMDPDQICSLEKNGFTIGAHSIDHPQYAELILDEQLSQTRKSIIGIKERTGIDAKAFAFPFDETGIDEAFYDTIIGDGLIDIFFGTLTNRHMPEPHLLTRIFCEGHPTQAPALLKNGIIDKALRRLTLHT